MDPESYRTRYFVDPPPEPRFAVRALGGVSLYHEDHDAAVAFFTEVLGPPGYVEGPEVRAWMLGAGTLTLFEARSGNPVGVEVTLEVDEPDEVDRLHAAFLAAGAREERAPADTLLFAPVRRSVVRDPFGTLHSVVARRPG